MIIWHCGTCENIFNYRGKPRACPECRSIEIEKELLSANDCLAAIKARIDGVWDNPALVIFGALSVDPIEDIKLIADRGLRISAARGGAA